MDRTVAPKSSSSAAIFALPCDAARMSAVSPILQHSIRRQRAQKTQRDGKRADRSGSLGRAPCSSKTRAFSTFEWRAAAKWQATQLAEANPYPRAIHRVSRQSSPRIKAVIWSLSWWCTSAPRRSSVR
eukprot:SAG11_NODE_17065_length_529_cov_1.679070_1_plen_127_part_10